MTLSGRGTNEYMKKYVIDQIKSILKNNNINSKKDKSVFAGLTYKKNVSDIRNSQALKIYNYFLKFNKNVFFIDTFINRNFSKRKINTLSINKQKNIKCIVLLVEHDEFKKILNMIHKEILVINLFNFYEKNH